MEYKRFNNTIIARIDKGEEVVAEIMKICAKEDIKLANINALGAVGEIVIGLFDTKEKKYHSEKYTGDFEIVSLTGSITTKEGQLYNHLHMSVGDKEYSVRGGHLNSAVVSATCELFINIIDGTVDREFNDEVGLNLLKFD
ncbi:MULTISPECIES: PPC domain-containing DNA-binding protein [unclassified Sedimentibacter]|uniref:PPC domain-containing DNA-binding protein n=1 Tax=unclassified Sedimentibacter TaxID=2649220 RepID=UPI0027DFE18A|nr:PPC domain-containing DNA-binding protein [Sedimentibacter sp. MB35-C1]WMJ78005.1 DNA-binding protein [Sedimentibacter sp. MB35-C1]